MHSVTRVVKDRHEAGSVDAVWTTWLLMVRQLQGRAGLEAERSKPAL